MYVCTDCMWHCISRACLVANKLPLLDAQAMEQYLAGSE